MDDSAFEEPKNLIFNGTILLIFEGYLHGSRDEVLIQRDQPKSSRMPSPLLHSPIEKMGGSLKNELTLLSSLAV